MTDKPSKASEALGQSAVARISAWLLAGGVSADNPRELWGELARNFPESTLAEAYQGLAVAFEVGHLDIAEATPEDRVSLGVELSDEQAELIRSGKPFPDFDGRNPSLTEEADEWVREFRDLGGVIGFDRAEGFVTRLPEYRAHLRPLAMLEWLREAEKRRPGLIRRVRERALGFDEMKAERSPWQRLRTILQGSSR